MVSVQTVPHPGFQNCLPSARVPGLLPPPPTIVQDYPFNAQTLPHIASQPDHSNPPLPAPTNPSPPSPNHVNSLRIFQWNSGGLSSSRRSERCSSHHPHNSTTRPQTISVSKSTSRSVHLFSSLMSTLLPSETLNSILDIKPFPLNFSRTPLTPLLSVISMSITPTGTPASPQTVLAIPHSIRSHPPS